MTVEEDHSKEEVREPADGMMRSGRELKVDSAVLDRLISMSQPARGGTGWIPRLKGESSWKDWHEAMRFHLERTRVLRFAETSVPRPKDEVELHVWKQERADCWLAIWESTKAVHDTLKLAGYVVDHDPHTLWSALQKTIGTVDTRTAAALVTKMGALNHRTYFSMEALLTEFFQLKDRLETIMELDDALLAIWLLNGVKKSHEGLYASHVDGNDSKPRFEDVLRDLNAIRSKEELEKRMGRP